MRITKFGSLLFCIMWTIKSERKSWISKEIEFTLVLIKSYSCDLCMMMIFV